MRRFSQNDVEKLRTMANRGFNGVAIAKALDRPALAIRAKACALGIPLRPPRLARKARVVVASDVLAVLRAAAQARGVTAQRLASMILSVAALEGLVDAILDDLTKTRRQSVPPPLYSLMNELRAIA